MEQKFFLLWSQVYLLFLFMSHAFCISSKSAFASPQIINTFYIIIFSFKILHKNLSSIINVCLFCDAYVKILFIHMFLIFQYYLLKISFLHWIAFPLWSDINWPYLCTSFSELYSFPLIHVFISLLYPHFYYLIAL